MIICHPKLLREIKGLLHLDAWVKTALCLFYFKTWIYFFFSWWRWSQLILSPNQEVIQSLCSLNPSLHSWDCQGGCHTLPADEMMFCEGDECPRKYSHSDKPLGSRKRFRKPQWSWNMSTWASFIITLFSSCLPIRKNSSLVACDLGGMKVEPCCSHYLKFQIFFGLLGYNTEHLIPLISSFGYHLIGWTLFNFFPFSSFSYFMDSIVLLVQWPFWVIAV